MMGGERRREENEQGGRDREQPFLYQFISEVFLCAGMSKRECVMAALMHRWASQIAA